MQMPSDMGLKLARELNAFCVSGLVMKSVSFMVPHNSSSGWPRSNEDISFAVRIWGNGTGIKINLIFHVMIILKYGIYLLM